MNSFQVAVTSDGEKTFVLFMYKEIQYGRGNSTSGFNAGDGVNFYALVQPFTDTNVTLERDSNVNVPGVHIFRVDQNQVLLPQGKFFPAKKEVC